MKEEKRGCIASGMPLSESQIARITQAFERLLGEKLLLSTRVDASLIAGIRVEVGGKCYDGTLAGGLSSIRKLLTHHEEERA